MQKISRQISRQIFGSEDFSFLKRNFPKPLTPRSYMKLLQHQNDLNKVLLHHKMVYSSKVNHEFKYVIIWGKFSKPYTPQWSVVWLYPHSWFTSKSATEQNWADLPILKGWLSNLAILPSISRSASQPANTERLGWPAKPVFQQSLLYRTKRINTI